MAKYEYKIVSGLAKTTKDKSIDWSDLEKRLNALVTEGWEVVSSNTCSIGLMVIGFGSLVLCHSKKFEYKDFNFILAFSTENCQVSL